MTLTHGSLFSGVGGMDLGFDAAGIETLWQCEIDKKCRSVLAKHWPDAVRYTDVSTMSGADAKPVDIITFGSPCQDLSVAGKRAGLAGNRSGLYHQAIRIIKEMRDATENQYPKVAVWENVRGALSSNEGKDFDAAIQALANLGAVDISYRVVNACNFGVPQRRVRVFVVATFGEASAREILSQPTRLLWHPPTSTESEQDTAAQAEESTGSSSTDGDTAVTYSKRKRAQNVNDYETREGGIVAPTLNRIDNTCDAYATVLIPETEESQGFDEYNNRLTDNIHHTLRAGTRQSTGVLTVNDSTDKTLAITERAGKPGGGKGILLTTEASPTLQTGGNQRIAQPNGVTYKVRRLTPRECERLMGWPDDHTRYDDEGKELSDTARYKMCGNGIATPVAQWLGENIITSSQNVQDKQTDTP